MVHLYSIVVVKDNVIIDSSYDLSPFSFWQKSMGKEICRFASLECAKRCSDIRIVSLEHADIMCYAKIINTELYVACVTDKEYPSKIVQKLLLAITEDYDLDSLLSMYQDVYAVDKMMAIQKELGDTIIACGDIVNKLCIREDELNDLLDRTEELSDTTKLFMIETKKLNKCCTLF